MSRGSPDRDDVSRLLVRFDGDSRLDESPKNLRSVVILRESMYGRRRCAFHDAAGRVDALRSLHPDNPHLQRFTDEDRVVLSEPPGDLPGAWLEVPESTAMIIQTGADETQSFQPHWP
jgi:glutamine amidotransferase